MNNIKSKHFLEDDHNQNISNNNIHNHKDDPLHRQQYYRNFTESEVSYEGNTIDMVRIVKKNQQSRRSRLNIGRKEYYKYQTNPEKRQRFSADPSDYDPQDLSSVKFGNQDLSTFAHQGTLDLNGNLHTALINYQRESQCDLLGSRREQKNKVVELIILGFFLLAMTAEFLIGSYYLNIGYVMDSLSFLQRIQLQLVEFLLEDYFFFIRFMTLLVIAQIGYYICTYFMQKHTQGKYKLIDQETSKLNYILQSKDLRLKSWFERITKSPYFTVLVIFTCSITQTYALAACFFTSQFQNYYYNQQFSIFIEDNIYQGQGYSYHITLTELFFYALLLPQTIKYIFFERMHVLAPEPENAQHNIDSGESSDQNRRLRNQYYKDPLTRFNLGNWWAKLTILVLFLSIIYSALTNIWLVVLAFSNIQISFKRTKYRIDSFYIEFAAKVCFLMYCIVSIVWLNKPAFDIQLQMSAVWIVYIIVVLVIFMFFHRTLAHIVLRSELYKHLYTEMNLNIALIMFIVFEILMVNYLSDRINLETVNQLVVAFFCAILMLTIYQEGTSRYFVSFDKKKRQTDCYIQMDRY